jgi:hypothetical protein
VFNVKLKNRFIGQVVLFFFLNLTTISQIFIKIAVLCYKHFMLENRNISINMGTEALVVV